MHGRCDRLDEEALWLGGEQGESVLLSGRCGGLCSAHQPPHGAGDRIVLQRPIYYPFTNKANSNGRIPVDNALIYENGAYRIDFEDLDRKMADPANKVLVVQPA